MRVEPRALLIEPTTHPSVGTNIQGPSLVRVPDFVTDRLGTYYLYFADHKGDHIRLAFADELEGPWTVHPGGALALADSHFLTAEPPVDQATVDATAELYVAALGADKMPDDVASDMVTPHIASPDVVVDEQRREFVMYFHGLDAFATQRTRTARSSDGVGFTADPDITVDQTYLRVFDVDGVRYGIAMPGQTYWFDTAGGRVVAGQRLFEPDMRHCGLRMRPGEVLEVFWTRVGDEPEQILCSMVDLSGGFGHWRVTGTEAVHAPQLDWEGAGLPLAPSRRGALAAPAHQLRDPFVFEDTDGASYLLYAVAGESGIGLARLLD